jgi:predicted transcriptional regulator
MTRVVSVWYHRWMAMTFRPPQALADRLTRQAEAERLSLQALLIKAAEDYLNRHTKKEMIRRSVDSTKIEFGEALRRLGEGA